MENARVDEAQAGIKNGGRNINKLIRVPQGIVRAKSPCSAGRREGRGEMHRQPYV